MGSLCLYLHTSSSWQSLIYIYSMGRLWISMLGLIIMGVNQAEPNVWQMLSAAPHDAWCRTVTAIDLFLKIPDTGKLGIYMKNHRLQTGESDWNQVYKCWWFSLLATLLIDWSLGAIFRLIFSFNHCRLMSNPWQRSWIISPPHSFDTGFWVSNCKIRQNTTRVARYCVCLLNKMAIYICHIW